MANHERATSQGQEESFLKEQWRKWRRPLAYIAIGLLGLAILL